MIRWQGKALLSIGRVKHSIQNVVDDSGDITEFR